MLFLFSRSRQFSLSLLILFSFLESTAQNAFEPNYLSLPDKNYSFRFYWKGDSLNNRWEPHAALLLPVTLPGCPRIFYMQFDLGAPSTVFYRSKLKEIHALYPKTKLAEDTAKRLKDLWFKVGEVPVFASEVIVMDYKSHPIDWKNRKGVEIIGTIGADFIENRVVMIDYPAQRFDNRKELPRKMASAGWTDFLFARRSVLLPATLQDKRTMLFFDTGSSAYELLTDKRTAASLAKPGASPVSYPVRSWSRTWTANTLPAGDSIVLATQKLPLNGVTYMEGVSSAQIDQMMKMGIGGMTGNKLFINNILILDTRSKKFAVLNK